MPLSLVRLTCEIGWAWIAVIVSAELLHGIGIGMCRFVGTALGIIGLASSSLGAGLGSKSRIFGRNLQVFRALLAQPRIAVIVFSFLRDYSRTYAESDAQVL